MDVKLEAVSGEEYGTSTKVVKVTFADNGQLPGSVNFRLKSDFIDAIYNLNVYYENGNYLTLESKDCPVIRDGSKYWVYFDLTHNSTFLIAGEPISAPAVKPTIKLSSTKYTYDGKAKKPSVSIAVNGKALGRDNYSVTYATGRKAVGKYKVTVLFKNGYDGSAVATFKIVPKKPVISSAVVGKKMMTVKMKTAVGKTYQIGYKIKGTKTWKYKTTTKQSLVIKSLKKGKQYQVKVRAYKTVSKVKYYGDWSKVKTTKKIK